MKREHQQKKTKKNVSPYPPVVRSMGPRLANADFSADFSAEVGFGFATQKITASVFTYTIFVGIHLIRTTAIIFAIIILYFFRFLCRTKPVTTVTCISILIGWTNSGGRSWCAYNCRWVEITGWREDNTHINLAEAFACCTCMWWLFAPFRTRFVESCRSPLLLHRTCGQLYCVAVYLTIPPPPELPSAKKQGEGGGTL